MEQPKLRTNRKNDGKEFERRLCDSLAYYQAHGFMRVKKVEQPIRMFGRRVIHLKNPFLDFIGCWTERYGKMISFEAKSTSVPKLQTHSGGLTEAQMDNLRLWGKAMAVSFLLWEHKGEVRFWTVGMIGEQTWDKKHLKFEDGIVVPQIAKQKFDDKPFIDFRQTMIVQF